MKQHPNNLVTRKYASGGRGYQPQKTVRTSSDRPLNNFWRQKAVRQMEGASKSDSVLRYKFCQFKPGNRAYTVNGLGIMKSGTYATTDKATWWGRMPLVLQKGKMWIG